MHGDIMYEMARQRIAELQRGGDQRRLARLAREGRGRRARAARAQQSALPVIPDFVHELFDTEKADAVPPQGS